ncbi:MAG: tol-pal system-associated acyl-CoA thioesterase [Steroidobacteraceae bacterium]|jgi:acyl-CoA thioester hydrolase
MSRLFGENWTWPVRVYWEDTDAGGVVYYANYLKFMERARTEWLRTLGVSQSSLERERGVLFMVLHVEVDYRAPARLDDELIVSCRAAPEGRTSAIFEQAIHRVDGELLIEGRVRVVCVDAKSLRPRRMSEYLP